MEKYVFVGDVEFTHKVWIESSVYRWINFYGKEKSLIFQFGRWGKTPRLDIYIYRGIGEVTLSISAFTTQFVKLITPRSSLSEWSISGRVVQRVGAILSQQLPQKIGLPLQCIQTTSHLHDNNIKIRWGKGYGSPPEIIENITNAISQAIREVVDDWKKSGYFIKFYDVEDPPLVELVFSIKVSGNSVVGYTDEKVATVILPPDFPISKVTKLKGTGLFSLLLLCVTDPSEREEILRAYKLWEEEQCDVEVVVYHPSNA